MILMTIMNSCIKIVSLYDKIKAATLERRLTKIHVPQTQNKIKILKNGSSTY